MATYTWTNGFSGFVATQFLMANNISYFYEQNYNSFFATASDNVSFTGNLIPINIAYGTVFTDEPQYSANIVTFSTALLNAKLAIFQNNATNVINAYSQTSSSYVSNTLNLSVSAMNLSSFTALQMYAPFLSSTQSNFAFNDILNNWQNGPQIISHLAGLMANFQGIISGSMQSTKSVIDFKTKLLRQMTVVADETSKLQQQANNFLATNTFSALASAFPGSGMPQFNQLLMNHNAALEQKLCSLVPVAARGASVQGIINTFLGGKIFNIISPMDKIIADINNANNIVSNLIKAIPTNGFTFEPSASAIYENTYIQNQTNNAQINNLSSMSNFTNQAVNLLNNIMSKIPISPSLPIPGNVTNPSQILNTLINTASTNYSGQPATTLSLAQQSIANMVNLLATTTSPVSSMYNPYINPMEPSQGGSFVNMPPLNSIFGGESDPTIQPPTLTIALDPDVSNNQYETLTAQRNVDAPGIFSQLNQGDGVNIFSAIPHTPRNIPLDGSLGDYANSNVIDISTS